MPAFALRPPAHHRIRPVASPRVTIPGLRPTSGPSSSGWHQRLWAPVCAVALHAVAFASLQTRNAQVVERPRNPISVAVVERPAAPPRAISEERPAPRVRPPPNTPEAPVAAELTAPPAIPSPVEPTPVTSAPVAVAEPAPAIITSDTASSAAVSVASGSAALTPAPAPAIVTSIAAAEPAVATPSNAANGVSWGRYAAAIQSAVLSRQRYPLVARRRGWQGEAEVLVRLGPDGSLVGPPALVRSSGYDILDHEALDMVGSAAPFDPPASGAPVELSIPIAFRIDR